MYVAGLLTMPVYRHGHPRPEAHLPLLNDPGYHAAARASFAQLPVTKDVIFIGDSRVGLGMWSERFPDHQVGNRGINGDTSAGVLERIETDVPLGTHTVVVEVGINDLAAGAQPEQLAACLTRIVAELEARGVARILLCSVVPITVEKDMTLHLNSRAARTNEILSKMNDPIVHWVDLSVLAPGGALEQSLSWDGVHFTGAAYLKWSALLRADHGLAARNALTMLATC